MRPVLTFLLRFAIAYAILLIPWPGLREGYAVCLRTVGNTLFSSFGHDGTVHFFPKSSLTQDDVPPNYRLPSPDRHLNVHAELRSKRAPDFVSILHSNSRHFGYVPTAFLVSLIIATPIPWRRRRRALALGLIAVSLFVVLKLAVWLIYSFGQNNPVAIFDFTRTQRRIVTHLYHVLITWISGVYVIPLLIWAAVSFRRQDLERLINPSATDSTQSASNRNRESKPDA